MPGTKYNIFLPSGAPLPAPCDIPAVTEVADKSSASVTLGEKAILEISQNGNIIQVVLNSVISYISKCLDERIKTQELIKILIKNYNEHILSESSELARSLLNKKDRPKRKIAN